MTQNGGGGLWLWVDPAREAGYNPKEFDAAAFLARAVDLFRGKAEWGGRAPDTIRANPREAGNGLPAAAAGLGLEVKADRLVAPGSYYLGIGGADNGRPD